MAPPDPLGAINKSNSWKSESIDAIRMARWRLAWMYSAAGMKRDCRSELARELDVCQASESSRFSWSN